MINLNKILKESFEQILLEGGNDGHLAHLYERGDLTFAEIRDIFKKLFTGKLGITEKLDGMNLNITYKDGEVKASRNNATLKNPMSIKDINTKFEGRGDIQKAYVNTMKDLQKALDTLDIKQLYKYFANGQKFMSIEIIHPGTRNVIHYNNRCIIVFHGINIFDDKFKRIGQDKEAAQELFQKLKDKNALKQDMFEISGPVKLKLKNVKASEEILKTILDDLDKIVDGLGYKATVADYAQERFIKYIVNVATKSGLDLNRNSDFVKELADRMSDVSGRRPTKSDIATYAKKEGLDIKSNEYKDFIKLLDNSIKEANAQIIMPLEDLTIKAGILLMQQLHGYVALDPSNSAKKISAELELAIKDFETKDGLDQAKVARFKKNLAKLEKYGKTADPTEGLVFTYKGKPAKLTGRFAAINQILGLLKY